MRNTILAASMTGKAVLLISGYVLEDFQDRDDTRGRRFWSIRSSQSLGVDRMYSVLQISRQCKIDAQAQSHHGIS